MRDSRRVDELGLDQQFFEVSQANLGVSGLASFENVSKQLSFAILHLQYFFLYRTSGDESVAGNDLRLSDAMGSVGGLSFGSRVPPGIVVDYCIGAGQV